MAEPPPVDEFEEEERQETLECWFGTMEPMIFGRTVLEACTHVGLRKSQEDRMIVCPRLFRDGCAFFGVFDGTVGDHASEFVRNNILQHLVASKPFGRIRRAMHDLVHVHAQAQAQAPAGGASPTAPSSSPSASAAPTPPLSSSSAADPQAQAAAAAAATLQSEAIQSALRQSFQVAFASTDAALLQMCTRHDLHYAACTAVAALLWDDLLTLAHVGDSKAVLVRNQQQLQQQQGGMIAAAASIGGARLEATYITIDHKPDQPEELRRIEANGGSLAWLHGRKPYIRGGDFFQRQSRGEHPKQLNYSRAFGGKDLKMFGLSVEPDVTQFRVTPDDRMLIIGSDGLWDVFGPQTAAEIAMNAFVAGKSASAELVRLAIEEMPTSGVSDNVTVLVVFFDGPGLLSTSSASSSMQSTPFSYASAHHSTAAAAAATSSPPITAAGGIALRRGFS